MRQELDIWVVGGDLRQAEMARLLTEDGHSVHTFALKPPGGVAEEVRAETDLSGIRLADCVILPLPVLSGDELLNAPFAAEPCPIGRVLDALGPRQIVCAGKVSPDLRAAARARELTLHDYFAREELAVANAVPTVEGAIQIALEELPITLHGARALVIGFGRLGKLLARRLDGLGVNVSAAARGCADLAWIEALGYGVEHSQQLRGWLCGYDLIINTVPARMLGAAELEELRPGCLVIDLASKPGGVDFEAAQRLGVKAVWALSLPGKTAPVTAGRSIRNTVYNILMELGVS